MDRLHPTLLTKRSEHRQQATLNSEIAHIERQKATQHNGAWHSVRARHSGHGSERHSWQSAAITTLRAAATVRIRHAQQRGARHPPRTQRSAKSLHSARRHHCSARHRAGRGTLAAASFTGPRRAQPREARPQSTTAEHGRRARPLAARPRSSAAGSLAADVGTVEHGRGQHSHDKTVNRTHENSHVL